MNAFHVLRDAWYFFSHNLAAIARLCLPLLAGLSTLAIMLGASLFVLPGLWIMIKLAFAEYLLVLRGLSPIKALHESFELTSGYFWQILTCVLCVMLPLWLLSWASQPAEGAQA